MTTERRESISAVDFLKVYVPMAQNGSTAEEIAKALGRDTNYVTSTASRLRKTHSRIPKLATRRSSLDSNVESVLDELLGSNSDDE